MNPAERKQFLQQKGILPPDPDALMPFPSGAPAQAPGPGDELMSPGSAGAATNGDETKPQAPGIGDAFAAGGRAYARGMGVDIPEPANPNDPRAKLRKLMTPELMDRLRQKAGMGGTTQ